MRCAPAACRRSTRKPIGLRIGERGSCDEGVPVSPMGDHRGGTRGPRGACRRRSPGRRRRRVTGHQVGRPETDSPAQTGWGATRFPSVAMRAPPNAKSPPPSSAGSPKAGRPIALAVRAGWQSERARDGTPTSHSGRKTLTMANAAIRRATLLPRDGSASDREPADSRCESHARCVPKALRRKD